MKKTLLALTLLLALCLVFTSCGLFGGETDLPEDKPVDSEAPADETTPEQPGSETNPTEGNDTPAHEHVWNEGIETKAPTCKEAGVKTFTCTVCGETKTEVLEKTANHTWDDGVVTTPASLTAEGVKTFTCSVCGETKTEAIPKTEAPSGGGSSGGGSSGCGSTPPAPVHTHTWDSGTITKAASCEEKGVKTYNCTGCAETKTEDIPATGHTWGDWVLTTPATCVAAGEETRTCTVNAEHKDTRPVAATGIHTWGDDLICDVCSAERPTSEGLEFSSRFDTGTCWLVGIGTCTDTDLVIPAKSPEGETVVRISDSAFFRNYSLKSVFIPDSVTEIGNHAFYENTSLESVWIGKGVTSIEYCPFTACGALKTIRVSAENPVYHSAGNCVIETASKTLVLGCPGSEIPSDESVTSIATDAFVRYQKTLPSSLVTITIPESITSIADLAFDSCTQFNFAVSNDHPTYTVAGKNCLMEKATGRLIAVGNKYELPIDGSLKILGRALELRNITIPASVTTLEACSITGNVVIPKTVTSIDGGCTTFGIDTRITDHAEITLEEGNENYYTEGNCIIEKSTKKVVIGKSDSVIPSEVKSIGSAAFSFCSFESIAIPSGVEAIESYAFYVCDSLTSIEIPAGVKTLGDNAFMMCSQLETVIFGDGSQLESIGERTFSDCMALTSINLDKATKLTSIGKSAFYYCQALKSITIPETLTSIAERTFEFGGLTSITIPDSVTSIGEMAFDNCPIASATVPAMALSSIGNWSLKTLVITSGTTIKSFANNSLESVTIAKSVEAIEESAFSSCNSLKTVTFESGSKLTSIKENAFAWCDALAEITIPSGVTSIGSYAFHNCSGLTSITIPDKVTSIGDYAFDGCSALTSATISGSITSIGNGVYQNCNALKSVTIPSSVTSIGVGAFDSCSALTDITFQGTKAQWEEITKDSSWNAYTGTYTIHCTDGDIAKE